MKTILILLSVILMSRFTHELAQSRLITSNGNKYYIGATSERFSWHESKIKCNNMDMHLLELRSVEQHMEFMDIINNNRLGNLGVTWAGASDEAVEGNWTWKSDGEPLVFERWYINHPIRTAAGHNRNCMAILSLAHNYQWQDHACNGRRPYNCYSTDSNANSGN